MTGNLGVSSEGTLTQWGISFLPSFLSSFFFQRFCSQAETNVDVTIRPQLGRIGMFIDVIK
jgi:hypothetical protein